MANNVSEVKSKVNSYGSAFARKLPYLLLILFCFFLTGVAELVKAEFKIDFLRTPSFWLTYTLTTVSCIMAQWSSALSKAQELEIKDEDGEIKKRKEALAEALPKIKRDVHIFIGDVNRERKIKAYLEKYEYKLNKYIEKHNYKLNETYSEYVEWVNGDKKKPFVYKYKRKWQLFYKLRCNIYFRKRMKKERKVSEEYVNKYINILRVKYKKITLRMIKYGGNAINTRVDDDTPISKNNYLSQTTLPTRLRTSSFLLFVSSFIPQSFDFNIAGVCIALITKVGCLIYSIIQGKQLAQGMVNETVINSMDISLNWIARYLKWKENRKDNN